MRGAARAAVVAVLLLTLFGAGSGGFVSGVPITRQLQSGGVALRAAAPSTNSEELPERRQDTLRLKVLTPEGLSVRAICETVSLPGVEGRLSILQGHAPLLAPVDIGLLRYKTKGEWAPVVVFGGYASVEKNTVTVLCNDILHDDAIPKIAESKAEFEKAVDAMSRAETRKQKLDAKASLKKASATMQAATMLGDERVKPVEPRKRRERPTR